VSVELQKGVAGIPQAVEFMTTAKWTTTTWLSFSDLTLGC